MYTRLWMDQGVVVKSCWREKNSNFCGRNPNQALTSAASEWRKRRDTFTLSSFFIPICTKLALFPYGFLIELRRQNNSLADPCRGWISQGKQKGGSWFHFVTLQKSPLNNYNFWNNDRTLLKMYFSFPSQSYLPVIRRSRVCLPLCAERTRNIS
jgi:hypothetical protein